MTQMSVFTVQQILLNTLQHFLYYLYTYTEFSLIFFFKQDKVEKNKVPNFTHLYYTY